MIKRFSKTAAVFLSLIVILSSCTALQKPAEKLFCSDFLTLTSTYPHSKESFTQGLFFYNGELYESVGLYSESALYKNINIESGVAENEYTFEDNIFAEGSVVFEGKLYVLTWKEMCIKVFNPNTLELERTLPYGREGWGLTTDGKHLIASDGTSSLYFMDSGLNEVKRITVTVNGKEQININELEFIDGYIWANIWLTDEILIIDKNTGETVKIIDFSGLHKTAENDTNDVLNGIAFNPETNKIYITGKRWDTLYEFKIK